MKIKIILWLSLLVFDNLFPQPEFKVTPDKDNYEYGDTVKFSITISNPTTDTLSFMFSSSCQVNYLFDDFNLSHNVDCLAVLTMLVLIPDQTFSRNFRFPGSYAHVPVPSVGEHILIGKLIGYEYSDTVRIVIKTPTSISSNVLPKFEYQLDQNYPNPFNTNTVVQFSLDNSSIVSFVVYNLIGQPVYQEYEKYYPEGIHHILVNLEHLPSGTYLYRIKADNFDVVRKMIFLK